MKIFLASPRTQQQAEHAAGMPVLLSFATFSPWLHKGYQQSFSNLLIDSGAFSELNTGVNIDLAKYSEWSQQWIGHADAIAGLDHINGDWRKSLKNYEAIPWGFPTWHDSDPLELLAELISMARERAGWLGIGLVPPRSPKENILRTALNAIPAGLHVHVWAGREFTHLRRIDSVDSTNWWRDAMALRKDLHWLTYGECLDLVVKRYVRWNRTLEIETPEQRTLSL